MRRRGGEFRSLLGDPLRVTGDLRRDGEGGLRRGDPVKNTQSDKMNENSVMFRYVF